MTRFRVAPLAAKMGVSPTSALVRLNVSSKSYKPWIANGMSWWVADRLAVRAGYHPAEIWDDWFDTDETTELFVDLWAQTR
jgi:hypothetical protein